MRHKRTNCTFNQGYVCGMHQTTPQEGFCKEHLDGMNNNFMNQPMCNTPAYTTNGYGNTTYETLPPIVTSSKNIVNTYHVQKQPYIHNYHTEVVHHHIKQAEFIPNYTCSETNVTNC